MEPVRVDVHLSQRSPAPGYQPVLVIRYGNVEVELEFTEADWQQLRGPFRRVQAQLRMAGRPEAAQELLAHFEMAGEGRQP
jgi:hypothetical protein